MKQFLAGLMLLASAFLAPWYGAPAPTDPDAPAFQHSINDDADPVGVQPPGGGKGGSKRQP